MARDRIDVKQAAQILGISTDAVHKRAKRGTLPSDKDPDGRVFVYLDNDLDDSYTRPDNGYTSNGHGTDERTDQRDELVEELRDRVRYLEEESRRKDHLLAAALERIPAIERPRDEPRGPETTAEAAEGTEPPETAVGPEPGVQRPTWWRRFFGFE